MKEEKKISNKEKRWFQPRRLQWKFALPYIVITFIVLGILNFYPVRVTQDLVFQAKQVTLSGQASVFASSLSGLETLTEDGVRQVFNLLGEKNISRSLVTDKAGRIIYDSTEEAGQRYAMLPEIASALTGHDKFYSQYKNNTFVSRAATPIMVRGKIIGAVYIYEADTEQGGLLQDIQTNLRNISLLIGLVVILTSVAFSRTITRRISALLRAIRIVREGEYSHRVAMKGRDELKDLAEEFNQLTDRLQRNEATRRRFVSDASHELKTPLASIRLLTDSILQDPQMDDGTTREFVADIGEEAARLHRITDKLLTLTKLDAAPPEQLEQVNLNQVVGSVLHMLTPLAEHHAITLRFHASDLCTVRATADDFYQIAFNLVENAIKYSYAGGVVTISLQMDDGVTFRVSDHGIGIPEEDLTKVFDRFYRVDKARSREAGGTGLGLSIVQEFVLRYGGKVWAARNPEGGTCFTVEFPADQKPEEEQYEETTE
ncbi:MAG: HAMP domain-containing protein [Oscillospiraceae bacterium]|nr:HAMP domain-containing protein [Oscillospiraceae bacterium]